MVLGLSPPLGELLKNFSDKNSDIIIAENSDTAHGSNYNNMSDNYIYNNDENHNNSSINNNDNNINNYDDNNENNNNDQSKNIHKNKKYFEENYTTTSINLFSGNLINEKNPNNSLGSGFSNFSSKSVKLSASSNQDKTETVSSTSSRISYRAFGMAGRPIHKSAVRSTADRELDNMTGRPNLVSRKKSENILRYFIVEKYLYFFLFFFIFLFFYFFIFLFAFYTFGYITHLSV